jgi:hypothetical protein
MSIVITDASLLQKLTQATSTLDFRDPQGNLLGTFAPPQSKLPTTRSPFSDEEIERRRKEPDGRPLADVLRDLENRG